MKKFLIIATTFALISPIIVIAMFIYNIPSTQEIVAYNLGMDVSEGEIIANYDEHGFHGDGVSCTILHFDKNNTLLQEIKKRKTWKNLPFDHTTITLLYGYKNENRQAGPYLTDDSGKSLVPKITEGYYTLIDRQPLSEQVKNQNIFTRGSYNLTLGIYDTKDDLLYYCTLDT